MFNNSLWKNNKHRKQQGHCYHHLSEPWDYCLFVYTHITILWFIPCLPGFFRWNSTQQSFSQRIRLALKTEWKVPVFWRIIRRCYTLHSTYGEEASACKEQTPGVSLTCWAGVRSWTRKEERWSLPLQTGALLPSPRFQSSPAAPWRRGVLACLMRHWRMAQGRRWHELIVFYFSLNMKKVLLPNMW